MNCPACKMEMTGPGSILELPYEADAWFCDPDENDGCGTEVTVPLSAYERAS